MMSSVRFRKISESPAVFEKKLVKQAKALHPNTIILTDDLWGMSLRSWISGRKNLKRKNYPKADFEKLILKTLNAGNDMFMITYPAKAVEMIHYLERLAKKNRKYREQIEESALKIILMKYKYGLLKPTSF
jgi:beta-N-acetylhexosaminidase